MNYNSSTTRSSLTDEFKAAPEVIIPVVVTNIIILRVIITQDDGICRPL
jgi:hypothetical protein